MQLVGLNFRRFLVLAALCAAALIAFPHHAQAAGTLDQQQPTYCPCSGTLQLGYTWAQTFTAGLDGRLDQVDLPLFLQPDPSFTGAYPDVTVQIQSTSGGVPSGTVLASATLPATSLPNYCCSVPFTSVSFSAPAPSVAGTQYAIVVSAPVFCPGYYGDSSNCYVGWMATIPATYGGGVGYRTSNGGATWDYASPGMSFKTYVSNPTPAEQLAQEISLVTGVGPGNSFKSQLQAALAAVNAGKTGMACSSLSAYANHVRAQSGKSVTAAVAAQLLADAQRIRAAIGC